MLKNLLLILLLAALTLERTHGYSATKDARLIAKYRRYLKKPHPDLNHAQIARNLVHEAKWASVGTISTNDKVLDYPMVNIISINDEDADGASTGKIRFMLTDLDFTGPDWRKSNKVTIMLSAEQQLHCQHRGEDPMEPTCARAMFSGQIKMVDREGPEYDEALIAFVRRHPAALKWIKAHKFYLCELDIQNIFVLDYYGGPHTVTVEDYYNTQPQQ